MAHDFEIRVKDAPWIKKVSKFKELREDGWHDCEEEYLDIPDEYRAYFFGYAEGIMYLAFNMESHCPYLLVGVAKRRLLGFQQVKENPVQKAACY